jgi:hypothetical protein
MINKRLLIKILAQNDEVAFMTKAPVEHTREGKQSFKTHLRPIQF